MKKPFYFLVLLIYIFGCTNKSGDDKSNGVAISKSGSINLGKTSLYYQEMGQGQSLIMLHGGFLDQHMWDDQFEDFAEHYRVIRYDIRGYGQSRSVPDTFSYHEDLHHLLEQLNIEKTIIMGLSLGGRIAIDFTLEYPEKVTALILAAPGLSGDTLNSQILTRYTTPMREAFSNGNLELATDFFLQAWTDGPYRVPSQVDSTIREKNRNIILENVKRWNPQSIVKSLDPPAIGRLTEIRTPTLTIVGDLDMPDIINIVNKIEKDIPGAQKVIVPGVAHMINMEKPEEFNKIVFEFLSNTEHIPNPQK